MNIAVCDGSVVFATHFIRADMPKEFAKENRRTMGRLRSVADGLVSMSNDDTARAAAELTKQGIPFAIESLVFPQDQRDKVAGRKYHSRTEAIQHLMGEIEEPESEIVPSLRRKNKELNERLEQAERDRDDIKERLERAAADKNSMNERLERVERDKDALMTRLDGMDKKLREVF